MNELERFEKDLKENEKFKNKFIDYANKMKNDNPNLSKSEIIEKFAKENDYNIKFAKNNTEQLSDENLAKISGGTGESYDNLREHLSNMPSVEAVEYKGSGPVSDVMSQIKHAGDVLYDAGKDVANDVYNEIFDWIWNLF